MKIDYVSDLHANHHVPFNHNQLKWERQTKAWVDALLKTGNGEVLVLAGDFSEWNQQTIWVLEEAQTTYELVLVVVGNHDYYILSKNQRKKYGTSEGRIHELMHHIETMDKVTMLHGDMVTYNHVTFAGHGLWYDLKTDQDVAFFKQQSNDSQFIQPLEPYKESYETLFSDAMAWYKGLENAHVDVFISHIPPLHPKVSPYPYNACYVSPVPFLKGTHWIAGHQHLTSTFEQHGVQFHFNALGYPSEGHGLKLQSFEV